MHIYKLSDLVGNNNTLSLLRRGASSGKLRNVIFLHGRMGTGKSTAAEAITLTYLCESPVNGEACLACESCTNLMRAFRTSGTTMNVVKKNIPALMQDTSGKKMIALMREMFELLQNTTSKNIYILEEVHAFPKDDQRVFLEYINGMSANTTIIMTTTNLNQLLPELVSRGQAYPFVSLNTAECAHLLDRTCKKLSLKLEPSTAALLIKNCKGVARDLLKSIQFIKDTEATPDEIATFLGHITNKVFIDLIESMKSGMHSFALTVEDLVTTYSVEVLVDQFKSFLLSAMFYYGSPKTSSLTSEEGNQLQELVDTETLYKLGMMMERTHTTILGEEDLKLFLLRCRSVIQQKPASSVISESHSDAVKERIHAQEASNIEKDLRVFSESESFSSKLTPQSLMKFKERK